MPKQESGVRPSRPLPYRPDARLTRERNTVRVRMINEAAPERTAQSAHFTIRVHDGRDAPPRRYDVAPGAWIEDVFAIDGAEPRALSVRGPNGFVRRFDDVARVEAGGDGGLRTADRKPANENAGIEPAFSSRES